jgi:class 3 adenylate cyclase
MTPDQHQTNIEIEKQIQVHAPRDRFDPTRTAIPETVRQSIREQRAVEAIVLSADIRRSASILKESIDIPYYANTLADFVGEFRTVLSYHGGWFDKFTGDGFLCYWLTEPTNFVEQMETVFDFSFSVMNNFRAFYYETFIANMRNVPTGIGLSVGIDAGPCYLLPIAGDLTVVGSPIVGAVRMNSACEAYQLMLNSFAGSRLLEGECSKNCQLSPDLSYRISLDSVDTKEYPDGQTAYRIDFLKKGKPVFSSTGA